MPTVPHTVYTDVSVHHQKKASCGAFYYNRQIFGAEAFEVERSSDCELLAVLLALRVCPPGPLHLVTDFQSLTTALALPAGSDHWERLAQRNPLLAVIRLMLAQRPGSSVGFAPGHSLADTPPGLKVCDMLTRAVTRRARPLCLRPGHSFGPHNLLGPLQTDRPIVPQMARRIA